MRVVMVEVGRKAYEMELENGLGSMQRAVGGLIQAVYEPGGRNAALICNEEGKLLGLPLNRALRDENGEIYDAIAGTFFICGAPPDSENFTSLTGEQVDYSSSTSTVRSSASRWKIRGRKSRTLPR